MIQIRVEFNRGGFRKEEREIVDPKAESLTERSTVCSISAIVGPHNERISRLM